MPAGSWLPLARSWPTPHNLLWRPCQARHGADLPSADAALVLSAAHPMLQCVSQAWHLWWLKTFILFTLLSREELCERKRWFFQSAHIPSGIRTLECAALSLGTEEAVLETQNWGSYRGSLAYEVGVQARLGPSLLPLFIRSAYCLHPDLVLPVV